MVAAFFLYRNNPFRVIVLFWLTSFVDVGLLADAKEG